MPNHKPSPISPNQSNLQTCRKYATIIPTHIYVHLPSKGSSQYISYIHTDSRVPYSVVGGGTAVISHRRLIQYGIAFRCISNEINAMIWDGPPGVMCLGQVPQNQWSIRCRASAAYHPAAEHPLHNAKQQSTRCITLNCREPTA